MKKLKERLKWLNNMASNLTKEELEKLEQDAKENEEKQEEVEKIEETEVIYGFTSGDEDES